MSAAPPVQTSVPLCLRLWLPGLLVACAISSGCSREFWREQANSDAYEVLEEKLGDPRWNLPRVGIEADSRSRFYDPYDRDRPPLPPDDPAAHAYMHWVNGRSGYKGWHDFGDTLSVENPQWLAAMGLQELDGEIAAAEDGAAMPLLNGLTLRDAIELSYIHSREYQTQIETLYLAALALTGSRFDFAVRYLGEPDLNVTGTSVPDGQNSVAGDGGFRLSQLLPAGGQWAVELANNTLWLFSGGNQTNTASVLSYSLVQPLLLGGGRKVVLENLTQGERNVLYAVRNLARFRQEFFTDIVGSNGAGYLGLLQQTQTIANQRFNNRLFVQSIEKARALAERPQLDYAVPLRAYPADLELPELLQPAPGTGLSYSANRRQLIWRGPMTVEQAEALLALSENEEFVRAVRELKRQLVDTDYEVPLAELPADFPRDPDGAPEFPGGLNGRLTHDPENRLLVWRGPLFNQDLSELEKLVNAYRELPQGDQLEKAVDQLRQLILEGKLEISLLQLETQLLTQQNQLRRQLRGFRDALDAYKLQLGLPPDLPLELDSSMLDAFQLIGPEWIELEDELRLFVRNDTQALYVGEPDLDAFRPVLARLEALVGRASEQAAAFDELEFGPVRELLRANQQGTAADSPGMRKLDATGPGLNAPTGISGDRREEDALTEAEEVQQTLVQNENLFGAAQAVLENLSEEVRIMRRFADMEDAEAVWRSLDADQDGEVTPDELPTIWNRVFRNRVDSDGNEKVTPEELFRGMIASLSYIQERMQQQVVQVLERVQIELRVELIPLNPFQLPDGTNWPTMEQCVELGLENRVDLMNARGRVMDARRQVEVAANRLEAQLDVVVQGNLNTPPSGSNDEPFEFRGDQSSFQLGLQFTAPTDQIAERNAYQQALINYQRERRNYMQFEDQVKQQIRRSWRQLYVLQQNIRIDRRNVQQAAAQYDSAAETATRATSTNAFNLLNALNAVLGAQNSLISDWVDYERNRLNIYRDMGIMDVDPRGLWYDDFYQGLGNPAPPPPEQPTIGTPLAAPESGEFADVSALPSAIEPVASWRARTDSTTESENTDSQPEVPVDSGPPITFPIHNVDIPEAEDGFFAPSEEATADAAGINRRQQTSEGGRAPEIPDLHHPRSADHPDRSLLRASRRLPVRRE